MSLGLLGWWQQAETFLEQRAGLLIIVTFSLQFWSKNWEIFFEMKTINCEMIFSRSCHVTHLYSLLFLPRTMTTDVQHLFHFGRFICIFSTTPGITWKNVGVCKELWKGKAPCMWSRSCLTDICEVIYNNFMKKLEADSSNELRDAITLLVTPSTSW